MDGIHDLGGMQGLGRVRKEKDEPVFHHEWERTVLGMVLGGMGSAGYNIDEFRHAIERMDSAHYLASGYYEHWLAGLEKILVEKGVLTREEIEARRREATAPGFRPPVRENPPFAAALRQLVHAGYSSRRQGAEPRFLPGDAIVVRRMHSSGHTRCPRYVRGASGVIDACYGSFILPDASAHGRPDLAEPLYRVRFEASELWGEGADAGSVRVDLWESYLEPTGRAARAKKRKR